MLREFAPAKINLYLHITGRRADGYHLLDSLTAFASVGDELVLETAPRFDFLIEGPQAAALKKEAAEDNLVVRALRALAERVKRPLNIRLTLIKNLPVASGIGGGSSDAAAALRALATYWDVAPDDPRLLEAAALCGQDVPVCLGASNCYITAEGTETGPELPYANIVLVNPGRGLATADVYKAYKSTGIPFSKTARFAAAPQDIDELVTLLKERANDLALPALKLLPAIGDVLKSLESSPSCRLARMSGSGATCFGIYPDRDSARKASAEILAANSGWWVIQSHIPLRRDRRRVV